jgi:GNAT superfamily N-acetyltransferase
VVRILVNVMTRAESFQIRKALPADAVFITALIDLSVRTLQAGDYSPEQIAAALAVVFGVDSQLIADGTYLVVQSECHEMVACGGWSRRKTLFGGDQAAGREPEMLNPTTDAARIRAFFVHPEFVRRGIGSMLLEACEQAAHAEGFSRFEMGATLTGVPLYRARGYVEVERLEVPLPHGLFLPIVRMSKAS